jgi:hypothetical protein
VLDGGDTIGHAMNSYGGVDPCPNCGSENVRWRTRRWYDVVFTYLRYAMDLTAGTLFGAGRTSTVAGPVSERAARAHLDATQYRIERGVYEDRAGTMTARRFWKCRECRQKGQVFDGVERVTRARERLGELEEDIISNLGSVGSPIRGDESRSD